jgi:ABC-type dipeptide/oligopeptide/nickel transport system permease component
LSQGISWKRYLIRRIILVIPTILAVILINFSLIHLAPGDPITLLTGTMEASPEYIQAMTEKYGLDKSLPEQLVIFLSNIFRGDFGKSIKYDRPVLELIFSRLPATLLLMGTAVTLSIVIGLLLGIISARNPYSLTDNIATSFSLFARSLPIFWLAQIILLLFAFYLGWFPTGGMTDLRHTYTGIAYVFDVLRHLFLPALTICLLRMAVTTRLTRTSMIEVLSQDYIITAKAKGVSERRILLKHALRNALRPVITITGISLGTIIAGATMTEIVFSWPGIGRLVYEAVLDRDYPILMGMYIFIALSIIIANFITDIVYAIYDPRVRYQ